QMQKAGSHFNGFNLVFGGDIPVGAGLSSSAALECATGFALNELFELGYHKLDLVKMGQAAENQFVGVNCGIMDQFTSIYGKAGHLLRLDCRSLEFTYIPFRDDHIDIVLFDTRIKHSLASSAYNQRRAQCEKGVTLIRVHHSEVSSLRDVDEEMLLKYVKPEDEETYRRCTYVVAEMERLQNACRSLQDNNLHDFGQRMFESHAGLRDLYQVSCEELDHLVNLVQKNPAVLGARMMGAGFGGCTINLVRREAVPEVIKTVSAEYKNLTEKEVMAYVAQIEGGANVLENVT
ncbi:MAG TPA: galactokinase, partial [Flavisolibacter sp.]|nr:galactokinase [Flavisolibacter sp.]